MMNLTKIIRGISKDNLSDYTTNKRELTELSLVIDHVLKGAKNIQSKNPELLITEPFFAIDDHAPIVGVHMVGVAHNGKIHSHKMVSMGALISDETIKNMGLGV